MPVSEMKSSASPPSGKLESEDMSESSGQKRLVRVKRKRHEAPLDSLWLEVTERPVKRQEVNFGSLSLQDAPSQTPENGASAKLLFRRVETLGAGVDKRTIPELRQKEKNEKGARKSLEDRQNRNAKDKKVQLLTTAKETHETLSRTARFERVRKSRMQETKGAAEEDPMQELYHLYEAGRGDVEADYAAKAEKKKQAREVQLPEGQLLCNYLPLLREYLPLAASDVEESTSSTARPSEEYEYDVYMLDEKGDGGNQSNANYPIFEVIDEEDSDEQDAKDSDYDSEDSNGEDNAKNDYPEEEDEEEEEDDDEEEEEDDDDDSKNSDNSDESSEAESYGGDNEEYDTVLSDEEEIWRNRR